MDAQGYLKLVGAYCQPLGGLRWSSAADAVEFGDGETFAFSAEIALFLEGFADNRRLIHFASILHLLHLLRDGRRTLTPTLARLHQAYGQEGCSLRNAGAFFGVVCRGIPEVPEAVDVREVCDRLRNTAWPIRWFVAIFHDTFQPAELPPVEPAAFEQYVLKALEAYTEDELKAWFRHGRGPVKETGEALARQLAPPAPRTLAGVLADLLQRPRLAGARPFIAQLVSALTLPPRRLAHQEIPVGGYADVTTHGQPDQILPSQFALDEQDFFRRFAERELLYFRREEPQAQVKHELIVLLDQGVRTWGDVRLMLAAAVLALGKQADRRRTPFLLATTCTGGEIVDPLQADAETLGQLVDESDLSPHPGLALERVLEQRPAGPRDVVLLTHPRSLREADVLAAARRATPGVRLFAVALDGAREVDLCELRHGVPVKLRHLRLVPAEPAQPVRSEGPTSAGSPYRWRGDVEPVGFPFRFGVGSVIHEDWFDFDHGGEWLLTATRNGMLHAWKVDGSDMLILPRGMWNGNLLTAIDAVVGVAGGFVVAGRINNQLVAMHYDFVQRTCTAHGLGAAKTMTWWWDYSREHHAVVAVPKNGIHGYAVDLGTGIHYSAKEGGGSNRAMEAFFAAQAIGIPARALPIKNTLVWPLDESPSVYLDTDTGKILILGMSPEWSSSIPQADGQPALKRCRALKAQCRGNTLALMVSRLGMNRETTLRLFHGPEPTPLAELPLDQHRSFFTLSADGQRLARQVGDCQVEVRKIAGTSEPRFLTRKGGFSQQAQFSLGDHWLLRPAGKHHVFLVRWDGGKLEVKHSRTGASAFFNQIGVVGWSPARSESATKQGLPEFIQNYDPHRFVLGATTSVLAVMDRFGQIAIFDRQQKLICMFFAFGGQIAAWMPDGTCFGPASLTGVPPTPDAAERIGAALLRTSQEGGRQP
jgi:hypothetical protein